MKNNRYIYIGMFICALGFLTLCYVIDWNSEKDPVPGSCTIFSIAVGDKVFFGNNEDYYLPNTYLWTEPATNENYGCIYVGFKDYAHQGGMNEKGLCFDANALPKSKNRTTSRT